MKKTMFPDFFLYCVNLPGWFPSLVGAEVMNSEKQNKKSCHLGSTKVLNFPDSENYHILFSSLCLEIKHLCAGVPE